MVRIGAVEGEGGRSREAATNWNLETQLQSFKFKLPQTTFKTGLIAQLEHLFLL